MKAYGGGEAHFHSILDVYTRWGFAPRTV